MNIEEKFILSLCQNPNHISRDDFFALQRKFARRYKIQFFRKDKLIQTYHRLLESGKIEENKNIENLLRVRSTRSLSGIVSVSVLTKPYPCPGNCLYCPNNPDFPKSYLPDEPAVMRASANKFDPYKQVHPRLKALEAIGHKTSKISVRIIGGTWSFYEKRYQTWFISRIFQAANDYPHLNAKSLPLLTTQKNNETAKRKIIELSVETRQDYINENEIKRLRKLGVTKVEIGVQSIYDEILQKNNRQSTVADSIKATKLLKDAGFKVSYQIMLNLYGSSKQMDEQMFDELFSNPDFMPDHLKIYPLVVLKEAPLYKIYQSGKMKIYNDAQLADLIIKIKQKVPITCRIERIIRDIPAKYIVAGSKVSNLRQIIQNKMKKESLSCRCIRCREIGPEHFSREVKMFVEQFEASGAPEYFLSFDSADRKKLYGMLRLRLPNKNEPFIRALKNSALVREMHVYGQQVEVAGSEKHSSQHKGLGKLLISRAEEIAAQHGYKKIAVIAGIGVKEYFAKLGYVEESTYMVKKFI